MKGNNISDTEKWSLFRNGDDLWFSNIYSEYSVKLFHYGVKFTPTQSIVEDVIQDLFSELYKNRKSLGDTDNILFYLMSSFKRKLLRSLKKEEILKNNPIEDSYQFEVSYSIEFEIIKEEQQKNHAKKILKVLQLLTPRQREAIYLRYTKELNYQEISDLMGLNVVSVRNLISKAIRTLRITLADTPSIINLLSILKFIE